MKLASAKAFAALLCGVKPKQRWSEFLWIHQNIQTSLAQAGHEVLGQLLHQPLFEFPYPGRTLKVLLGTRLNLKRFAAMSHYPADRRSKATLPRLKFREAHLF